jgi:hypothetical protein
VHGGNFVEVKDGNFINEVNVRNTVNELKISYINDVVENRQAGVYLFSSHSWCVILTFSYQSSNYWNHIHASMPPKIPAPDIRLQSAIMGRG